MPRKSRVDYERRSCDKTCYPTKSIAKRIVKDAKRARHGDHWKGPLTVYLCKVCRAWHLGHRE